MKNKNKRVNFNANMIETNLNLSKPSSIHHSIIPANHLNSSYNGLIPSHTSLIPSPNHLTPSHTSLISSNNALLPSNNTLLPSNNTLINNLETRKIIKNN